jgi:hypothetical protein
VRENGWKAGRRSLPLEDERKCRKHVTVFHCRGRDIVELEESRQKIPAYKGLDRKEGRKTRGK